MRRGNAFNSLTFFAPLGPDRAIRIRSKNSNAWVVVDYMGYFSPLQSTANYFAKTQPQRVLDTRGFAGSPRTGALAAGQSQEVQIRGNAGVPSTANAVAVNITGFEATGESYLLAYGANSPGTTTVTVNQGEKRSGLGIVPIDENGKIRVASYGGTAGVALDVVGWFGPGAGGAKYVTLPEASRIADTATGNGLPKAPVGHGQKATVQVGGVAGVSSAATSAALVVTGLDPNLGTDLSVSPSEGWTPASSVNTRKAEAFAGLVLAPLGNSGKVDIRNERGQTRLSADVTGYFIGGSKVPRPAPRATARRRRTDRAPTAASYGADGAAVSLAGCDGTVAQQWVLRTDGRLISRTSGRCATPNDGNRESQLTMRACDKSRSDQVWQVPAQNGRSGKVVGVAGKCLDVPNNDPTQNKVALWPCNGSPAQSFAAPGDGTLRATGKCIDVTAANTADGSAVALWECNGNQAQQWVAQPDGSLVNPISGRCLTAASSADNATLSISNCTGSRTQTWSLTAEWLSRGGIVGIGTKCIDVYGNDPNASRLWLWDCFGPAGQLWWAPGDGTFRIYGKCLDIGDTVNLTSIVNVGCQGGASQQWTARHDGTLVSALAGRCVDDMVCNTDNGTALVIYDCHRAAYQRWATPVNPS